MSKIAEKRALEAYPADVPARLRFAFRDGYEAAEKDLAIDRYDIGIICNIAFYLDYDKFPKGTVAMCEEVLRKYNEYKNDQQRDRDL